jgi:hypothetical protein
MPPNTTSLIQPLDQGIIRNFKVFYRQLVVRQQLAALEQGKSMKDFSKSIDVLQVIRQLDRLLAAA